jgi:sugar O-acyltransferase (sialic acid O-acetyltransferase NeuD family)
MNRIAVIGAGLVGQQVAHHIRNDQGFEPVGFFDDYVSEMPVQEFGPVLGKISDVERLHREGVFDQLVVGIGYQHFAYRWDCFQRFKARIPFLTFIHSSCWVDESTRIGAGSFLMPGILIDDHVEIGENVFMQVGCSISHHSTIKENCFLGPRVTIAGCVTVERDCFLGVGSVIIDSVNMCPDVKTGGGAVVIESIREPGLYVGVPARKIR